MPCHVRRITTGNWAQTMSRWLGVVLGLIFFFFSFFPSLFSLISCLFVYLSTPHSHLDASTTIHTSTLKFVWCDINLPWSSFSYFIFYYYLVLILSFFRLNNGMTTTMTNDYERLRTTRQWWWKTSGNFEDSYQALWTPKMHCRWSSALWTSYHIVGQLTMQEIDRYC